MRRTFEREPLVAPRAGQEDARDGDGQRLLVEARDLEKRFKTYHAVRGVSFACYAGEVFGLLGPNGAGKTTTIRMLTTVLRPTAGTARIAGHDVVREAAEVRRTIGVLPENAGVYGRLTAREAIRYAGRLYGLPPHDLERRIVEIADALELTEHLDRLTDTFSKGMKQKVNVARALIHDPPVVFLDEPTSGLDVISARSVRDFVLRFKAEGRCVILSTHVMDEAERLCDRVAIIAGGRIRAEGALEELKAETGKGLEEIFMALVEQGVVT
ncbi:MAG TPA: ABC transporter ATP-binding protein [bacterium]|nr:ABC transporter ATP-binding protein [bacterium]